MNVVFLPEKQKNEWLQQRLGEVQREEHLGIEEHLVEVEFLLPCFFAENCCFLPSRKTKNELGAVIAAVQQYSGSGLGSTTALDHGGGAEVGKADPGSAENNPSAQYRQKGNFALLLAASGPSVGRQLLFFFPRKTNG